MTNSSRDASSVEACRDVIAAGLDENSGFDSDMSDLEDFDPDVIATGLVENIGYDSDMSDLEDVDAGADSDDSDMPELIEMTGDSDMPELIEMTGDEWREHYPVMNVFLCRRGSCSYRTCRHLFGYVLKEMSEAGEP